MWGKDETEDVLERARIFLRLRRSLRDLFFFHFSLILRYDGWFVSSARATKTTTAATYLSCDGVD